MKHSHIFENNFTKSRILACYLRLSDEDFDLKQNTLRDESASISAQRQLIHSYIESNAGLSQMEIREFVDDGYSGTNFERPGIQEILRLASDDCIGCIIVKDMSRFGRNYIETGRYIEQLFPFMGIRFIAINDSFDSSAYTGNTPGLETAFKNVIYDYYSRDLSAKVKSTRKLQQKRGDFVAARPPYGYIISHNVQPSQRHDGQHPIRRRLVIDPESAEVVRTIFSLTLSEWKPFQIAQRLNKLQIPTPAQRLHRLYGFQCGGFTEKQLMSCSWKPWQITKILQDETMTGATVNNRVQVKCVGSRKFKRQKEEDYVVVRDTHEAIVDRDTFLQAAAIIQNRKTVRTDNRRQNENLFYRKIYCGQCGCRLKHEVHTRRSHTHAVYYCPHARPSGGGTCSLHSVEDAFLKKQVLGPLQVLILLIWDKHMPLPKSDREKLQDRLYSVSRLLKQNKGKVPRLYEEYRTGHISREQFVRKKNAVSSTDSALQSEKNELEKQLASMKSAALSAKRGVNTSESLLETAGVENLTQCAVDIFVDKIVVSPGSPRDSTESTDIGNSMDSIEIVWKSTDFFKEMHSRNA